MGALDWFAAKLGYARAVPRRRASGFDAALQSRLTASLQSEAQFINTTLRHQLRILRARSRQAAQNNPFARRFVQMVVDNVCGPVPFRLEGKVKNRKGDLDEGANEKIEEGWQCWGRPGNCEITGKWSWNTLQRLLARNLCVDGELLLRKLRGPEYGPHGYRLQVIDIDRLHEQKNAALAGGGAIHAGVEVNASARPVAYHIVKRLPSQWQLGGFSYEYERIPAEDIIHVFVPEFAEQVRGVPWMYAALLNLVHLGAFEEAAVIAARIGAANMGFIESPDGGQTLANLAASGPGTDGNSALGGVSGDPQISAEPGAFHTLPPGYKVGAGWNPQYPDAAVEPFIKAMLRGVSAGLGVAYHNLANDLEGVNYSSARIGELDERDAWMGLQTFLVEHLNQPIYEDWLRMQLLTGKLPFDPVKIEKYQAVYWQPRRWAWVDPLKEVGAQIEAINARIKSRSRIAAENGEDLEDTFEEIAREQAMADKLGIDLGDIKPQVSGSIPPDQADGGAGDAGGSKARAEPARVVLEKGAVQVTTPVTNYVRENGPARRWRFETDEGGVTRVIPEEDGE